MALRSGVPLSIAKCLGKPNVGLRSFSQGRQLYATSVTPDAELYDVVCIGGGPAGLSLLTALRASPVTAALKVALVESQDLSPASAWSLPSDKYSNRASSLTPASKAFLQSIGVWDHLDASRVQAYHSMQVWDGVSGARIEFDWQKRQDDFTIAYMNENANLLRALLNRISILKDVSIFDKTRVASITLGPPDPPSDSVSLNLSSWPHVKLSDERMLATRLLVGADGLNSPVRTFAGISSHGWDYNRHGVVATLRLDSELKTYRTAFQRFLPTGPVALLPLPGPYATLVWSTLPTHAARLQSLSHSDFVAMVNAAFRLSPVDIAYMHTMTSGQLSELEWREKHTPRLVEGVEIPRRVLGVQDGSVASFPLRMRHASTYTASRVALVGDAAHTIHPLAGQGLNMGIGDVDALVKTLEYAVSHGQDIGDQLSLESYNAKRYEPNNRLLGVVDKLHKLYSVGSGPLVSMRSWGLRAVDLAVPLKSFLMRQAAGVA